MIEFLPGETKEINVALVPVAAPGILKIERFFVAGTHTADDGDFYAHCHIANRGESAISGQLHCIGEIYIAGGQLTREIDETETVTLQPGQVYDYVYHWYSYRGDAAWVQMIGDWGEQTPRLDFVVGYYHYDPETLVEVKCTATGSDYAILRYCQRSYWDVVDRCYCRTPPPPADREHQVSYPRLNLPSSRSSLYHAMLGLLPGRTYLGKISAGSPWRSDTVEFTTK